MLHFYLSMNDDDNREVNENICTFNTSRIRPWL